MRNCTDCGSVMENVSKVSWETRYKCSRCHLIMEIIDGQVTFSKPQLAGRRRPIKGKHKGKDDIWAIESRRNR